MGKDKEHLEQEMKPSPWSGFYRLSLKTRRQKLAEHVGKKRIHMKGLSDTEAERMVENTIGVFGLPMGVCVHLRVNGRDWAVPMAIEEASVIAAASHAAKLLRGGSGIEVQVDRSHMIGQIQILDIPDFEQAQTSILKHKEEILALANRCDPALYKLGGGAFDLHIRCLEPVDPDDPLGSMMIVHLLVDVQDAMGANAVNTMCEAIAPTLERWSQGRVRLRILSNLAVHRKIWVKGKVPIAHLDKEDGLDVARGIVEASVFAERDPSRAATHNKGIMNGIDAVLIAFGQDWRAVEAGAHAYAARNGRYTALSKWRIEGQTLYGTLEMPLAVGTVGGIVNIHPTVRVNREITPVKNASELASIVGAVGLAQNLAALRALAKEGIQKGHMRLHARNLVVEVGAKGWEIEWLAHQLAQSGQVQREVARELLQQLRKMDA